MTKKKELLNSDLQHVYKPLREKKLSIVGVPINNNYVAPSPERECIDRDRDLDNESDSSRIINMTV